MTLTSGMFGQEKMKTGMSLNEMLIGMKLLRNGSRANKQLHSGILFAQITDGWGCNGLIIQNTLLEVS